MKTVFETTLVVPASESYQYRGTNGVEFNVTGPGEVYIRAREFVERRVATTQRRARGDGRVIIGRRYGGSTGYGRRAGDREAHQERRSPFAQKFSIRNAAARRQQDLPMRRKGDEQRGGYTPSPVWVESVRAWVPWVNPRRRKTDERRNPARQGMLESRYRLGLPMRRKGDERRVYHHTYKSSSDPRIVALERRGKCRWGLSSHPDGRKS